MEVSQATPPGPHLGSPLKPLRWGSTRSSTRSWWGADVTASAFTEVVTNTLTDVAANTLTNVTWPRSGWCFSPVIVRGRRSCVSR